MKKFLSLLMTALLALTLALTACTANNNDDQNTETPDMTQSQQPADTEEATTEPAETEEPEQNTTDDKDALGMLNTIWAGFSEDEKFPVAGGDMSEENMNMEGPGKYSIEDTAALDSALAFPEAAAAKIDGAASLVHMMNANTFTCGVFHVANAEDVAEVASAIKDNIANRQWMCGFPDKMVIMTVDDTVISFFGTNEFVDLFKAKTTATFASAETVCDEPIA